MPDNDATPGPEHAVSGRPAPPDRQEFCALLRSLADPAWVKDLQSRYLAVNEPFVRMLGRGSCAESIVGRTDDELFAEPLSPEYRSQDLLVAQRELTVRAEVEIPRSDGPARRFAVTRSPYRDASGAVAGIVGLAREVEPARGEAPADALRDQLSRVAHELSSPLNTILSFAELMRMDPRPPEDDEALRTVQREAERAGEIVERLRRMARDAAERESPAAASAPPPEFAGPVNVLVVDDEPSLRSAIQCFLERRGHRVAAAKSGAEALALLEASTERPPYDVILCDMHMPGLCGDQLLECLRGRGDGLHRRVVFMTGDAARAERAPGGGPARAPALIKPVQLPEVARIVEGFGSAPDGPPPSAAAG